MHSKIRISVLLSLGGVNKTFIIWVELSSVIVRDHFVSLAYQCMKLPVYEKEQAFIEIPTLAVR